MPNGGGNFPKNRDNWEASEAPEGGGPSPQAGPGEPCRSSNYPRSTNPHRLDSDDANPDDDAGGEDDDDATNELADAEAAEVDAWESDNEDDEHLDEPPGDENDDEDETLDGQCARATWTDVPSLNTDPRAQAGAMPEHVAPAFLMPSYRDEPLLSWFLFYMPLPLIDFPHRDGHE